ncbi:MAG: hypothetical protein M4579_007062 [Chaenotheca gracillima]|nr:MAG: hypothetical protein M4579_007062 [Chaenotheca gracillima]
MSTPTTATPLTIPKLEYTPVNDVATIAARTRRTFLEHKTRDVEWRLGQLRKLYWGIKDNEALLTEASRLDLGRSELETQVGEIIWCENDILFCCDNLPKWAEDEKAPDIELAHWAVRPKIRKDPLGNVLILGAYNFPLQLTFGPLIGAITAGCTAVIKPSELAANTAVVLQKIVEEYLDPEAYGVVQGAVPETTALLDQKWDKIFYTGGAGVGTIIAKKAAETLTPVTLELGGRNPAIVTKTADVHLAARRLLWGKHINAGQVCIGHNYTIVDREVLPLFVEELKVALKMFYPNGARASPDYARIVNDRHFLRIKAMLDNTSGKILIGGTMDEKDKFIEPTVVMVEDQNDSMLTEESFGPLLPILAVDDLDQAIRVANEVHSTPLGIYPFGKKAETDKILRETRSGGASINDSYFHGTIPTLAFGGVGDSGQGSYRGKSSFDCFTHRRSITNTPGWFEMLLSVRYPPYAGKLGKMQSMMVRKPNFDRQGRVKRNFAKLLLTLGGGDGKAAAGRWVILVLGMYLTPPLSSSYVVEE